MSWLSELFGGVFGGKPPKYTPQKSLFDGGGGRNAQAEFQNLLAFVRDRMAGKDPYTQAEILRMLMPTIKLAASNAEATRERLNERGASMGHLAGSGMLERARGDADRAQGEQVATAGGNLANIIAQLKYNGATSGAQALAALLSEDQAFRAGQAAAQHNAAAQRATAPGWLGNLQRFGIAALAAYTGSGFDPASNAGSGLDLQGIALGSYRPQTGTGAMSSGPMAGATLGVGTNPFTGQPYGTAQSLPDQYSSFGNYVGLKPASERTWRW